MSCQALGEAIVEATAGDGQGNHALAQAQALKDVLTTLGEQGPGDITSSGQRLTGVPADAKGYSLSVPPTESARALGVLDGIADSVTRDLDEQEAQKWRAAVLGGLDAGRASEEGLAATWLDSLSSAPEAQRYERLRTQGADMTRLWTERRSMDEPARQGLLAKVERSALAAYREVKA
ncbi:hypothetical protein [Streptomyces sp. NPDC085479]|uniref:hypothetical protein n=1 Tax=Streptomyces sp. NPDC085479 TaxID=3365726 RepID=UPI0037CED1BC